MHEAPPPVEPLGKMTTEQALFFCETCLDPSTCPQNGIDCEGDGFYELDEGDVTCPCCEDLVTAIPE